MVVTGWFCSTGIGKQVHTKLKG